MDSEKVKEIKEKLQEEIFIANSFGDKLRKVPTKELENLLTLINELESENERLSKEKEDLRLFDIALGNGKVDMTLGGNTAKSFINAIVQVFEQNNATNFLATTIESISSGNKYSLVIQKENGQTPSEKLSELKDRIAELEKENEALSFAVKQGFNDCQKKALKQFAKRVEEISVYYKYYDEEKDRNPLNM